MYLGDYSEQFAIEQVDRLNGILSANLGELPLTGTVISPNGRTLSRVPLPRRPSYAVLDHLHGRRGRPDGRRAAFLEREPRS